jgi:hypothetical protein
MDDLALALKDAATDADDVIKSGRPPAPFLVGFEPSEELTKGHSKFQSLVGVSALIRMFSAMNTVAMRKSRGEDGTPPSLGDPAKFICALNDMAEATVKALTAGPLVGIYRQTGNGSTQTEEQLLKRSDLHGFVLPRIFGGIRSITKTHMEELDKVLTTFVSSIRPFKVTIPSVDASDVKDDESLLTDSTTVKTATIAATDHLIKFVVLIHHVRTTDITGDGTIVVCEPMTRMVNLNIRAKDWPIALHKPSKLDLFRKNEKVAFKMTTTILDFKLDEQKFIAAKSKFEIALKMMVGKDPTLAKIVEQDGLAGYGRQTCTIFAAGQDA